MRTIVDNNEALELLQEDFREFLYEEQILNEGKILDKIRWKLALFSLRFLKEDSLNDFLSAYYADNNGKPTEKQKEWLSKSKKEKRRKLRELANQLKPEARLKVCNQEPARQLESKGITNFIVAGVSGATAAGAAYARHKANEYKGKAENDARDAGEGTVYGTTEGSMTAKETGEFVAKAVHGKLDSNGEIRGDIVLNNGKENQLFTGIKSEYGPGSRTEYTWDVNPDAESKYDIYSVTKEFKNGNLIDFVKDNPDHPLAKEINHALDYSGKDDINFAPLGQLRDSFKKYKITDISVQEMPGTDNVKYSYKLEPVDYYGRQNSTVKQTGQISMSGTSGESTGNIEGTSKGNFDGRVRVNGISNILNIGSMLLGSLATILFGVMWGALIVGGISAGRGIHQFHRANIMRRDEIIAELRKKKGLEESYTDFELYQILDENGYSTDSESLQILKEGIVAGDFVIE